MSSVREFVADALEKPLGGADSVGFTEFGPFVGNADGTLVDLVDHDPEHANKIRILHEAALVAFRNARDAAGYQLTIIRLHQPLG